jgi:Peptidase family S41
MNLVRTVALSLFVTSCGSISTIEKRPYQHEFAFRETFAGSTLQPGWRVRVPDATDGATELDDGTLRLTMLAANAGDDGEITMLHRIDALPLRGKRVRLTMKARTEAASSSFARAVLTMSADSSIDTYGDNVHTRNVNSSAWTTVHVVMDVAPEAVSGELKLVMHGTGSAWFDDISIAVVGPVPLATRTPLSPQQLRNVVALARAISLIRYLHPSDQAADLDWDGFLPTAIDRVLRVSNQTEFISILRALFAPVAPTAQFSRSDAPDAPLTLPQPPAAVLARWRRYGPEARGPFLGYREGRDQDLGEVAESIEVPLQDPSRCKSLEVHANALSVQGSGTALLAIWVNRAGIAQLSQETPFTQDNLTATVRTNLPSDTHTVEIWIRARGRVGLTLSALSMRCDSAGETVLPLSPTHWKPHDQTELYTWASSRCSQATCTVLERKPLDTQFTSERDLLDVDLSDGIRLRLPLAVWADATHTLPAVTEQLPEIDFSTNDLPSRLGAITTAWAVLAIFYPYFDDQKIDWPAALSPALQEAASATTPEGMHRALAHMVVHLQDNHARVTHAAAPIIGVLPFALRRFGDKIVVIGGVADEMKKVAVGDELVSIDGVPAAQTYDLAAASISAATEGFREYQTPLRMASGLPGTFRHLMLRRSDGTLVDRVVPLVSFIRYGREVRERRPATGQEVSPGVYYVDFNGLSDTAWAKVVPALGQARAVLLDFRGYTPRDVPLILSFFINHEVFSPQWQTPRVPRFGGDAYTLGRWSIRPSLPHLSAKVVALTDGRTMSAMETSLQIFRDNALGRIVGERSGGTNGNVSYFDIPGGFQLRFTAMRAGGFGGVDSATIQGHGIEPDRVVHPTLDGVRAGRDEILDAGIAEAIR